MTPIIILSAQRSGTHALTSALSYPNISTAYNEILHKNFNINKPIKKFYHYLNYHNLNENNIEKHFNEYIDYISKTSTTEFCIFNVKYNQIKEKPFILDLFINRNYPIIHLIRSSAKDRFIEKKIRKKTKESLYRNVSHDLLKTGNKINIDFNKLEFEEYKKYTNILIDYYNNKLKEYNNKVILIYEETFNDNKLSQTALKKLKNIIPENIINIIKDNKIEYIKTPYKPIIKVIE